jgi:hypothetical protein
MYEDYARTTSLRAARALIEAMRLFYQAQYNARISRQSAQIASAGNVDA